MRPVGLVFVGLVRVVLGQRWTSWAGVNLVGFVSVWLSWHW